VLLDDLGTVAAALATGLFAAAFAGRTLESVLSGVSPGDPWMLASAAGTLLAALGLARLAASLRASTVHPAQLLRD
jgi:hypothetical protein